MKPHKERRKINGDWVRALRKEMGLNQTDFAHRVGVSVPSVARWELDLFRPTILAANALRLLAITVRKKKLGASKTAKPNLKR
jgi:DNA-binding transcriptional regulator YiaG